MSHNREPRGGGIELLIHRRTQIELGPGVSGAPQRRMCELDHDDAGQSGVTSHHSQAIDVSEMAMSKIFTVVKPALLVIDAVITRTMLWFWMSTLQAQLGHEREPQH